jgi:hypothetical protein
MLCVVGAAATTPWLRDFCTYHDPTPAPAVRERTVRSARAARADEP